MKGKEFKNNESVICLLDGKHKVSVDFNTYEELEEIYGDMETALTKFSGAVKFTDVKNFLCASVNSCIENQDEHYTPFIIGKLLEINKLDVYVTVLTELITNSMPEAEEGEDEADNQEIQVDKVSKKK